MKEKRIKYTLLILILFGLSFSFIQSNLKLLSIAPLCGAIVLPEKSEFTIKNWFSGTYQEKEEKYINDGFGLRNVCIRINNQVAFSLFKIAKANGVVVGKENYLYELNYIKAYYGRDYIGYDSIYDRMKKLSFLKDTLEKLNKKVLIVFAPGKASFYPEFIPEKFRGKRTTTNFEIYLKLAKHFNINYIDFKNYFIKLKHKSKYPLYPQYGIHWSYYTMCLATDSIIHYYEKMQKLDLPDIKWDKVELQQPKESDYDVAEGMNIKFRLKSFKMAYPKYYFESDSNKSKTNVMVISDSFYWGIFNQGSPYLNENHFWFYNNEIYPDSYTKPKNTSMVDLRKEISKHDIIMLMATEATLPNFGWGFIENAYNEYKKN